MAKDKEKKNKQAAQGDEQTPIEEVKADEAQHEEEAAEVVEDCVTFTKEEFEQAKAEIEKLREQAETSKKAAEEAMHDAQRLQAEFANFRKRNASIRADSIDDGVRDTIKNMLPVLDNFERAFMNAEDTPFAKGMEQIHKQLIAALEKCGMEEVEAEGQFDPNLHEVVMQDTESDVESGTITAVLQKGYRVKGRVIRHTMVKVKA
ncbi:MAG: nucleotide exchange factor GrpE [Clostridia bacterium]|nr:nucleotide exchange factor GrpE [Clostridia bacterium]